MGIGPAQAQTPVSPPELTAQTFAKLPFVSKVTLSPKGDRIAGLFAVGGQQVISMRSLFDANEKQVVIGVPDGTEVDWVRWVNDDNIVVGLRVLLTIEGGDRWYVSRALGINRLTGKLTKLLWDKNGQDGADLIWTAQDGSPEILLAAQSSIYSNEEGFWPIVYRVNVEKGRAIPEVKGRAGVMNWSADGSGKVRLGLAYNDLKRTFQLIYRSESEWSFKTVDRASTRADQRLDVPVLLVPGTDHGLVERTERDGTQTIHEIDLLTDADIRTVYTAPAGSRIDDEWISSDRSSLLGIELSGVDGRVHWVAPDLALLQADFDKSVGSRRLRIADFNRDRSRMLVIIDRPENPGLLYFYDTAVGKLSYIAPINDMIGPRSLSPVKAIKYKARDGLEIEAILTLPKGRAAKNLPVVVFPHGGPWGQDTLHYDYQAQYISSLGYAVIQPNFRGSTGYGETFLDAGQGQFGLAMQDDVSDALHWLVTQGIADPKRACIAGASYGGYAAMWGVAREPDLFRCAISVSGVASLSREVSSFGDSIMGGKFRDDWKKMTPDFAAVSPLLAVDRIKTPLLLIHGKKDVTVDVGQSVSMFNRMKGAGKAVEFVQVPEADHYFTREADRLVMLNAIGAFLTKHNPADPPAPAH